MTLLAMNDYERIARFHLRCRSCHHFFESFDRDESCRLCGNPTEVYGIEEHVIRKTPESV